MVIILTEVIYLSRILTLLRLLSMFSYILSVVYYSQELSMSDFTEEASFVPDYEEDMEEDTKPPLCIPSLRSYLGGSVHCAPPEQQLLNLMFCEHTYLGASEP